MANFPADIRCSSLALVAGQYPSKAHVSQAGNLVEVQGMNREAGARIRVSFRGITRADLLTIRQHYEGEGQYRSWLLSAVLLDGAEFASEIAAMRWRYVTEPQGNDITDDVHNLDLELEHVPETVWVERYVATAPPITVVVGASARLIGPDVPPTLWVSRLTTAGASLSAGGPNGGMAIGPDGVNFQVFWNYATGESTARVVVVKRDAGGSIAWQRWSSSFGDNVTARDSYAPCVLALSDGGCVVAAQDRAGIASSGTPTNRTMRVWRLESDGDIAWEKDLTVVASGPKQLAINGSDLLIGTDAVTKDISPTGAFNTTGPALIRMSASTGSVTSMRAYKVNSEDNTFEFRSLVVLSNGRIAVLANRSAASSSVANDYLLEVSADLATTHVAYGYATASVNNNFMRIAALLPDGGMLCAGEGGPSVDAGFLRLNSSYQVQNHYMPMSAAGGLQSGGAYTNGSPITIAADANGEGYFLRQTTGMYYLSAGTGAGVLRFTSNGSGLGTWSEVAAGSGAGNLVANDTRYWQQIDLVNRRAVAHISKDHDFGTTCRVTAIGFDAMQPTSTAGVSTAAATLDTGSCSNTISVRGWDPALGQVDVGAIVTRSNSTAPNGTITCTAATAAITLTDCSSSLSWERKALVA